MPNATHEDSLMPSANTEEALFLQMEKELDAYGRAFERGEKKTMPEYDPALFLRFRRWQAERLEAKHREWYGDEDE